MVGAIPLVSFLLIVVAKTAAMCLASTHMMGTLGSKSSLTRQSLSRATFIIANLESLR